MLPSQERKQYLSIIEMLLKGCRNKNSYKINKSSEGNNITVFLSSDYCIEFLFSKVLLLLSLVQSSVHFINAQWSILVILLIYFEL